jgi:IS30 family transposase
MRVQVTDLQVRSWRLRGFSLEQIARACGSSTSAISHRIQRIWQEDQERAGTFGDPDEAEIRRRCEEIQREWSAKERQKREVGRGKRWTPAVVPVSLQELVHD